MRRTAAGAAIVIGLSADLTLLFGAAQTSPWGLSSTETFFVVIGSMLTVLVLGLFGSIIFMAMRERPDDVSGPVRARSSKESGEQPAERAEAATEDLRSGQTPPRS